MHLSDLVSAFDQAPTAQKAPQTDCGISFSGKNIENLFETLSSECRESFLKKDCCKNIVALILDNLTILEEKE